MNLRNALSVLAKSSPFAVRTLSERPADEYIELKDWLFVKLPIETDFQAKLDAMKPGEIVFLCGSSGDGKSEILVRYHERYHERYRFHLDATHSFGPRQSAIEALDTLFDDAQQSRRPLVLGINVGMLANYSKEGAERHRRIREAIDRFLAGEQVGEPFHFLDFEKYPKFEFSEGANSHSPFAKQLMQKLTAPVPENPFYRLRNAAEDHGEEPQLLANFRLLGRDEVQDAIIAYLFKARLSKEQFITARSLLDFLHHLLTADSPLADNLFGGSDNELVQRVSEFDPALRHTKALDEFVLRCDLAVAEPDLDAFMAALATERLVHREARDRNPRTLLRLFSLLERAPIGNDYHRRFEVGPQEDALEQYARIWFLHDRFDGSTAMRAELRRLFYTKLQSAIHRYANRNSPQLDGDEIFLGERGAVVLAAKVEIKADFPALLDRGGPETTASRFLAHILVEDHKLDPVPINLNLYELIDKLHRGYRPNKYDKNSIVFLDDLVDRVVAHANRTKVLKLYDGSRSYTVKNEDGMIEVGGFR